MFATCFCADESALRTRPWVRPIPLNGDDLGAAFETLRVEEGIQRVSAIGGAFTATQLVDAGLIQDIYLTTTSLEGGEPGTPWSPRDTVVTGDHKYGHVGIVEQECVDVDAAALRHDDLSRVPSQSERRS